MELVVAFKKHNQVWWSTVKIGGLQSVWWTRLVLCSSVKFGHGLKAEVVALVETGKTSEVRLQQMAGL